MKIEKKIIYKKEPERDTEFVCQYIVAAGSNTDLFGKNGISHFIEHFLIHLSKRSAFFNDVIIHGFTGFYYTNYYWFVHSRLEAVESFCEFEKIISDVILGAIDEELFINTKKEIEEEIVFYKEKTNKLSNIVSSLFDNIREVCLPIGKVNEVKKIEYDISVIIVKDFSRFGRDHLEVGNFLERILPVLQIRFISVNDNFDSGQCQGMTGGMSVALKNILNEKLEEVSEKESTLSDIAALQTFDQDVLLKVLEKVYVYGSDKVELVWRTDDIFFCEDLPEKREVINPAEEK